MDSRGFFSFFVFVFFFFFFLKVCQILVACHINSASILRRNEWLFFFRWHYTWQLSLGNQINLCSFIIFSTLQFQLKVFFNYPIQKFTLSTNKSRLWPSESVCKIYVPGNTYKFGRLQCLQSVNLPSKRKNLSAILGSFRPNKYSH